MVLNKAEVNNIDDILPLEEQEDVVDDRNHDPDYEVTPADKASEDDELLTNEYGEPLTNNDGEPLANEDG